MRLVRSEQSWRVLSPSLGEPVCLHGLSLGCGYRVGQICAELECSERYLYEVFTRDVGLPPKEWMRSERAVVALRMLEGGNSLEVVAEDLGFASVSGLRREFLAMLGVSPVEFLRSAGGRVGEDS